MAGSIGIKEANGGFYSILEENSAAKKRLVLTTVHDSQKSVQIDLYKSIKKTMADAAYIGSLVVENISDKPKGEPSIEMIMSSSPDGSISAQAVDLNNPKNEHHLNVSLKSLEEDKNDYPDFEVEEEKSGKLPPIQYKRRFPWLPVIIIGLLLALLCLGLWYFLFRNTQGAGAGSGSTGQSPPVEAPPAVQTQTTEQPAAPPPEQKPVVVEKPPPPNPVSPARNRQRAPVYSFNVPETIPPEGIAYTVRWGDTLWDISEAFYRNPRYYPFIVRSNNIRNSNLIISGSELTILPRE